MKEKTFEFTKKIFC